jgi:predicted negative regulator of RcsB-dependent stress response
MAYDLEEQEQIDGLKAFWSRHGNLITTVITVVLLAIAAYRGWLWYQGNRAGQAAVAYEQLRVATESKDLAKVQATAGVVLEGYSGTIYGPMAALLAAKAYTEGKDLKNAKANLQWLLDKAPEGEFRQVARVRMAGLLLDEKQYDDALKVLATGEAGSYAGSYADRRGDILLAQGKTEEARAAYKQALERFEGASPLRRLVQLKLDSIGSGG